MADFTRSLDKTRPVMAVLSRSYLKDNAAPALDIIGINRYFRFVSNLFQFLIINVWSMAETFTFRLQIMSIMSGSCHLDRASNVEIGVECQIFVIVIFFNCG